MIDEVRAAIEQDLKITLIDQLGEGSYSEVWKGKNHNKEQAIKISKAPLKAKYELETEKKRLDEIKEFDHTNIESLHGYEFLTVKTKGGRRTYLVTMCQLGGKTFEDLQSSLSKDLPRLFNLFRDIAEGIDELQTHGFHHCDIKPNNLLLGKGTKEFAMLCDLGMARMEAHSMSSTRGRPPKYVPVGAPGFISTELLQDGGVPTRTSDLFSLAVTYVWMRTKRDIFSRAMPNSTAVRKRLIKEHQNVRDVEQNLKDWFVNDAERELILQALSPDSNARMENQEQDHLHFRWVEKLRVAWELNGANGDGSDREIMVPLEDEDIDSLKARVVEAPDEVRLERLHFDPLVRQFIGIEKDRPLPAKVKNNLRLLALFSGKALIWELHDSLGQVKFEFVKFHNHLNEKGDLDTSTLRYALKQSETLSRTLGNQLVSDRYGFWDDYCLLLKSIFSPVEYCCNLFDTTVDSLKETRPTSKDNKPLSKKDQIKLGAWKKEQQSAQNKMKELVNQIRPHIQKLHQATGRIYTKFCEQFESKTNGQANTE